MTRTCEACRLTNGDAALPGGRVFQTTHWVVEHCIGALGVGTLIVKPFRHTVHLSDLRVEETAELGPLLQRTAKVIQPAPLAPGQRDCSLAKPNRLTGAPRVRSAYCRRRSSRRG